MLVLMDTGYFGWEGGSIQVSSAVLCHLSVTCLPCQALFICLFTCN